MTASGCFIISTIYGGFFMPNPSTEEVDDSADKAPKAASGFFAPIKVLMPQHFRLETGKVVKHWGLVFLAFGVFFGVVGHVNLNLEISSDLRSLQRVTPLF